MKLTPVHKSLDFVFSQDSGKYCLVAWSRTWVPNSWPLADQNQRSSQVQTAKSESLRSYQLHEVKISKPRK